MPGGLAAGLFLHLPSDQCIASHPPLKKAPNKPSNILSRIQLNLNLHTHFLSIVRYQERLHIKYESKNKISTAMAAIISFLIILFNNKTIIYC